MRPRPNAIALPERASAIALCFEDPLLAKNAAATQPEAGGGSVPCSAGLIQPGLRSLELKRRDKDRGKACATPIGETPRRCKAIFEMVLLLIDVLVGTPSEIEGSPTFSEGQSRPFLTQPEPPPPSERLLSDDRNAPIISGRFPRPLFVEP